ncbi:MAG: PGF-pre-PGF domain-containing protein, partial [Candidatus Woesearchaeota archaeon]
CTDNVTNTQTNTTSFTTLAGSSSSSSSSSGGGGATGAAGGVSNSAAGQFEQVTWTSINAGETAKVSVPNGEIGVTKVSFGLDQTKYGVWMKVAKLDNLPSEVKKFDQKVYKYIEITKSLTLKESDFKKAQVDFKVAKSWLTQNKFTTENVALYRYADGKWTELKTTVGKDDGTYIHYTASTPGFSYFLIGQKAITAAAPVTAPKVTEPTPEVSVPVPELPPKEVPVIVPKNNLWKWVIGALVLIVIISWMALTIKKRKYQKKR